MESAERVEDPLVQGQSSAKQKLYLVRGRIPRLEAWGEVNREEIVDPRFGTPSPPYLAVMGSTWRLLHSLRKMWL